MDFSGKAVRRKLQGEEMGGLYVSYALYKGIGNA